MYLKNVLKIFKKTSIAVACSRWEEPFGRTSLEASSRGCAVIVSNRGGLPETITNGIIVRNMNVKKIAGIKLKLMIFSESFLSKNRYMNQMELKHDRLLAKHSWCRSSSQVECPKSLHQIYSFPHIRRVLGLI